VEAISRIMSPTNKRQLRRFLGKVNYYRDMWRGRSHVLAPLMELVSNKAKWNWTKFEESEFEGAKKMVIRDALLSYPDFSGEFHVYADAGDYQLAWRSSTARRETDCVLHQEIE
jgi:hypothetical protein